MELARLANYCIKHVCFLCFPVAVPTKIGRGRVEEDRRSRHCPYLDTINRLVGVYIANVT